MDDSVSKPRTALFNSPFDISSNAFLTDDHEPETLSYYVDENILSF